MSIKLIASNKKARYDYDILEKFEAGIVLQGSEVKSLREGNGNVKESYIKFLKNELWVIGMHIAEYSHSGYSGHTTVHDRKLLLHKRELINLKKKVDLKGVTMVPLSMYFKNGKVKVEFGLARGKKNWDKRQSIMKKDLERQTQRTFKGQKISL
ncbi:MAG: SsrA-binding protein [Candidatus Marinimicrobia bacterium]|nr:SsrA-binding protein [Candidatus Neomarinimicrobiota bacterium]|tara:strand:- start:1239 stop:1700 length:462 start_codon:yes stop_codon:yes gene_type:complete